MHHPLVAGSPDAPERVEVGQHSQARREAAPWRRRADPLWIIVAVSVIVVLACSPALIDSFELPKLIALKLGLAAALLALAWGSRADPAVIRAPAVLAALAFLVINTIATFGSIEPRTALLGSYRSDQGLLTLAVQVGYFLLAASWIRGEAALARLAAGLAVAAASAGLYGIAQQLGFDLIGWTAIDPSRRATSTLGHPDALGGLLVLTLPLTGWLAWREAGWRRDLALWSAGLQAIALVVTQARAAWLAFILSLLAAGLILAGRRLGRGRRLVPAIGAAPPFLGLAACAGLILAPGLAGRIDGIVGRGEPLARRVELWGSALNLIADRPLFGWGPDTFRLVYPGYRSTTLDLLENVVLRADTAHNAILSAAANAGWIGAAAFLSVFVAILWLLLGAITGRVGSAHPSWRAAALTLLAVWGSTLIVSLFGRPWMATDWLFWIAGGAAVGLFGSRPPRPERLPAIGRLLAIGAAAALLIDAVNALAADTAYGRAVLARDPQAREAQAWASRARDLRPVEPVYHLYLGQTGADRARGAGDREGLRRAHDDLLRASTLLGHRDPELLTELARVQAEWEVAGGETTNLPWEYLDLAIEQDPDNPLIYTEAADLALDLGQASLARDFWEMAHDRAHTSDALRRLGRVALRLGEPAAAREAFLRAIKLWWPASTQSQYHSYWGEAALVAGLPGEAVLAYGRAVELMPEDSETRLKWAEALAADGRRDEALREARRVQEERPEDARAAELIERIGRS
ncbi:MAG TPA: O-antigen ligase family protein [Dehalococcoidia bacterium]|nr:O-antigen ligase family protein [Dehalococcoidia bacterium]